MITYVINTSENKTFDSDRLFSLAGYTRIVWMNCTLDQIENCANEIYDRQNTLTAESFRVAVIVDFYNFTKIRKPYGITGFAQMDEGIDLSLYYPFIEVYLADNLFDKLARKNLNVEKKDLFYIQSSNYEKLENINNAEGQIKTIIGLDEETKGEIEAVNLLALEKAREAKEKKVEPVEKEENGVVTIEYRDKMVHKYTDDELEQMEKDFIPYGRFFLPCTETITLDFNITDLPLGKSKVTFHEFYEAIVTRNINPTTLRRHYYYNTGSLTPINAAIDTLTLSLHIISLFEEGRDIKTEGDVVIPKIPSERLIEVLVTSWNKIHKAQEVAKDNRSEYYDIVKFDENGLGEKYNFEAGLERAKNLTLEETIKAADKTNKYTADEMYGKIIAFAENNEEGMSKEDFLVFNKIMEKYLEKRDETRETSIAKDVEAMLHSGSLNMTTKFPSKVTYETIIENNEEEVSRILKDALAAELVSVDYSDEKKKADKLITKYRTLERYRNSNLFVSILFFIFVGLMVVIPYALIQRRFEGMFTLESFILYGLNFGVTFGILVLVYSIQETITKSRLKSLKFQIQNCLDSCEQKRRETFSRLKQRYEDELIVIENLRYKIRQINYLHRLNNLKNYHIRSHRAALEDLEDYLSSLLNNLGIEPVIDDEVSVEFEFDVNEPIKSPNNKVYQIFSLEKIEFLFTGKGGK